MLAAHRLSTFLIVLLLFTPAQGVAEEEGSEKKSRFSMMKDPEDGHFDMSQWLGTAKGFLPSPIIITEPAVGYGGGFNLLFLHDSIKNRAARFRAADPTAPASRVPPPSLSGVAGAGTENGTWLGGVYHLGIWRDDRIRFFGLGSYASVNYDFYPAAGSVLPFEKIPVNIEGSFLLLRSTVRLADTNFFAGLGYRIQWATAEPDVDVELPAPADNGVDVRAAGGSLIFEYDSRDNIFTPDSGIQSGILWTFYETWLGSKPQFNDLRWQNRAWMKLGRRFVLGTRLDCEFANGSVPFYLLPSVNMRGVQAMEYVGDQVIAAEAELRWDFTSRWSLVGFGGTSWTSSNGLSGLTSRNTTPAGGMGFRYLLARVYHIRGGIDVAVSDDGGAFYVTMGSAW